MDYLELTKTALAGLGGLTLLRSVGRRVFFHRTMPALKPGNNIGRIYLRGPIQGYSPATTPLRQQETITPNGVEELVTSALADGVKGLIFDIDSPGGAVVPSKEIADYITRIEIPTVALVKGAAASGAYWTASACDAIVANEFSIIGSIGVILPHHDVSELARKLGIAYDGIKSGQYKDMGSPFRSFTSEERRILQEELDTVHEGFITTIAQNREMEIEKVRSLANGLIYHGKRALELGLVDALGNTQEAVEFLERKGDFKSTGIRDYKPKRKGLFDMLKGEAAYQTGRALADGFLERVSSQTGNLELK